MILRTLVTLVAMLALIAPATAELRQFNMTIEEVDLAVAPNFSYKVWAFNGQVPGPPASRQRGR
ncbi:MAG: hypothetical protein U5K56_15980 [Halioglobus sp.]|nr:hypothetical protein [Halioglobus sp.]